MSSGAWLNRKYDSALNLVQFFSKHLCTVTRFNKRTWHIKPSRTLHTSMLTNWPDVCRRQAVLSTYMSLTLLAVSYLIADMASPVSSSHSGEGVVGALQVDSVICFHDRGLCGLCMSFCSFVDRNTLNPLDVKGNYNATSNDTKLVHWPLMGGLLHLVQR